MSKHYDGVKHEPKSNDRPSIALPDNRLPEGKRLPMRYEGTEIGYAIILEGGRTANITITSEKHRDAIVDRRTFISGDMTPRKKEEA